MIDSVLKGTGNSRFLKSAVPAGTSWADALAMLQAGTFPIDFNGINTEGFQQVGTPLNKANLLKDATAAQIGLPPSTTPDGMFQALGNTGELHVWRKTVTTAQEIPAGYKLGDAESGTAFSVPNSGSQNYVTLQYGPSITVNDGGGVSLTSVTGSVQFKQYSDVSAIYDIRNNFVKAIPNGDGTSTFDGVIFVPNDCSFKNTNGIVTFGKFYRVNAYPLTPAGTTTTYPVSTNPNAYQEGDDAKEAGYTLGDVKTGSFAITSKSSPGGVGTRWNDSAALSVSDDGTCTLATTGGTYIDGTTTNAATTAKNELQGKFAYCNNTDTDFVQSVIVFFPSNTIFTKAGNIVYADRYQPVTGYPAIPAGTTIEYLGKLGDKAMVQVVSYVGTGTYGKDNPCSLTFDFAPKLISVSGYYKSNSLLYGMILYPQTGYGITLQPSYSGGGFFGRITCKTSGKTVSWYADEAGYQLNLAGVTYTAVAIG